jgi:hypothetical protein
MTFEDLSAAEQERVVIAELLDRAALFGEAGRSSMPIRLSEVEVLLKHALADITKGNTP